MKALHHHYIISISEDIEHVVGTIEAEAVFSFTFDLQGLIGGTQQLVAGLDSDQVELVSGELEVNVIEDYEPPLSTLPEDEVTVVSLDNNLLTNRRVSPLSLLTL